MESRDILNGTNTAVFLNGEEIDEIQAFQAKLEFQKEEIRFVGKMAIDSVVTGYAGKGSATLYKKNSRMIKLLLKEIKAGKDPRCTFIGKIVNKNTGATERVVLKNVSFDDLTIFDYELGQNAKIECPFIFTDLDVLDEI